MRDLKVLSLLGALLAVAACATAPDTSSSLSPSSDEPTRTILVSIDGFRADYLDRGATPVMSALAEEGARAAMESSFPTKTFPNHYTLVTGLVPDHHGIINNTMEDPEKPGVVFKISDRAVASDPDWWEGGKPIWVSAEERGLTTATMFWPGSDYEIYGQRPSIYAPFDQKLPDFARVDLLLSWLDLPEEDRPEFLTLYFDIVDTAGHLYGPDSPKTVSATAQVDAAIGRLVEGLEDRGLMDSTNLVIVADHGMAPIADERIMNLDERVAPESVHVVWTGAFAGLSPEPGYEETVKTALLGRGEHGECWTKETLPERFDYGSHPRVPAIICLADTGWRYETAAMPAWRNAGGDHGYDPEDPTMAAIFIAHGPAFREGVTLESFQNTAVYQLLARLLNLRPEARDGSLQPLVPALK